MDDFNVKRESNMRNVSMQNDTNMTENSEFNVVRPKKIVPEIGLDLLANQKRKLGSQGSMSSEEKDIKVDDESGFDDVNLKSGHIPFTAPSKVHGADQLSVSTGSVSDDESVGGGGSETTSIYSAESSEHRTDSSHHHSAPHTPHIRQPSFEDIQAEKQNLLSKIKMMEERYGMQPTKRYTIMSNVDDLRSEYAMMKRQRGVEKTIKFGRKALLATVSGIEWLNNRFDPIGARLSGWSEAMAEELDDYNEIFEELHDKYSSSLNVPPELSLLFGVGGSAIQYHIKKSLFTSNMPGLNEILRNNPDIMRNIATAAGNSMNRNMAQDNQPAPTYRQPAPAPSYQPPNVSRRQPSGPIRMDRMSHPSGVDDILNEIGSGNAGDNRFETLSSASESTMALTQPGEVSRGRSAAKADRQKRMLNI